jgi:transketolase
VTSVKMVSTRQVYGETLLELGRENPDIVVLGGDLNRSTFAHLFGNEFSHRFFDFGPAEQNIIGVAAGLASSGKTPFVSTFAVFGTGRPFDQLRVAVAQPHLNVKLVCTHAGILTAEDGVSAQSIEDLALACSLPGFTVVVPSDALETAQAIRVAASSAGPFYIRLSRPATPIVHNDGCHFSLGKAEEMRQGHDVTIIATGTMVATALEVAGGTLAKEGNSVRVLNLHTLVPVDETAILNAASETKAIVTVEEHYIHGGLGSIVAQVLAKNIPVPLETVALTGYGESGKPSQLLSKYGLGAVDVERAVYRALQRKAGLAPI